ncbi:ASX homology domain-containing protein [Delphinella strobiligena]|nr:ASX homology domain-containing protein [Delphinella strobiligena]
MNTNTRLLTQSNSKLAKADIIKVLANEEAWSALSEEQQIKLYDMLPPSNDQATPLDHRIHPFRTEYAPYIKHFLHEWQTDLKDGRNTLKWHNEARQASGERAAGMYDEVLAKDREEKWGVKVEDGEA